MDSYAEIAVPGSDGTSNDDFAARVLVAMPPGTLYRYNGLVGHLQDGEFSHVTDSHLQIIIDRHVRLYRTKQLKDQPIQKVYVSSTKEMATLIRAQVELFVASGAPSDHVRVLRSIARFPTYPKRHVIKGGSLLMSADPGWNPEFGIFSTYNCRALNRFPVSMDPISVLVDFPFASEADRWNCIAFLVAVLIRPAINGNVPISLITAPQHRTGKTLLAADVLGAIILGESLALKTMPADYAEIRKLILAEIMRGQPILGLDNIDEVFASPAIASLITTRTVEDRILGESRMVRAENRTCVLANGNNLKLSPEIALRCMPIRLESQLEDPSRRSQFQIPNIREHVLRYRHDILQGLCDRIESWDGVDGTLKFGGFENFASIVSGILRGTPFMENRDTLLEQTDSETEDLRALVQRWLVINDGGPLTPGAVAEIIIEMGNVFPQVANAKPPKGPATSCGRILARFANRIVLGHRVSGLGTESGRRYQLLPIDRNASEFKCIDHMKNGSSTPIERAENQLSIGNPKPEDYTLMPTDTYDPS